MNVYELYIFIQVFYMLQHVPLLFKDRNVNLEAKLMELDTKRDGFVQILIEQEKKVLRQ